MAGGRRLFDLYAFDVLDKRCYWEVSWYKIVSNTRPLGEFKPSNQSLEKIPGVPQRGKFWTPPGVGDKNARVDEDSASEIGDPDGDTDDDDDDPPEDSPKACYSTHCMSNFVMKNRSDVRRIVRVMMENRSGGRG